MIHEGKKLPDDAMERVSRVITLVSVKIWRISRNSSRWLLRSSTKTGWGLRTWDQWNFNEC